MKRWTERLEDFIKFVLGVGGAIAVVFFVYKTVILPLFSSSSSSTTSSSIFTSRSTPNSSSTTTRSTPSSAGPTLSAMQLEAVLVPGAAYNRLLPDFYGTPDQDPDSYALQGGIPALKLCNSPLPAPGLGNDASSAYRAVPAGARPFIYFASDAASFTGGGAAQFLAAASEQGPARGWRLLPGPDSQFVRLTMDVQSPNGDTLHGDVILVRSGFAVGEVGTATTTARTQVTRRHWPKGWQPDWRSRCETPRGTEA